jgi:hypothetical protein
MEDDRRRNGARLGHLHEEIFKLRAQQLGYTVFTTTAPYSRIDAILLQDQKLSRVQIKTGNLKDGILHFKTSSKAYDRKTGKGSADVFYTAEEVDFFGVYCPGVNKCWLIPISYCQNKFRLRLVYDDQGIACIGCLPAKPFEF